MIYTSSNEELRKKLKIHFPNDNIYRLPNIKLVTISIGTGKIKDNKELIQKVKQAIETIAGQKSVEIKAKKSISAFKLRAGQAIGFLITLRKKRAYDFITKLFNVIIPRIRDFRGLDLNFLNNNTFNIGISEINIIPEINEANIEIDCGIEISITFTSNNADHNKKALELLGAKFK